ncbi:UNVERIFIED_CONTAM: Dolichyl-diphosphooligosaccharide--protein glycosyltransferase subunit [Sesamum angustifolium]|uniref:Dolichyl-diphosphooligosaccharide--protein glycosyltransferase 48 kDa subunit n=1 Tax=Sesamum angustifolium TaxID=2727405 RepID=A0AAW2RMA7_9LAMI
MGSLLKPIHHSEMAGQISGALLLLTESDFTSAAARLLLLPPITPLTVGFLFLLDDLSLKSRFSLLFPLQSRGFDLDFKLANDPGIAVKRYGATWFGGSLDMGGVLEFVDSGHDLILAADSNASDLIRNIAAECGVDFDELHRILSAVVIDHTSYAVSETEGEHTLVAADDFIQSDVILGSKKIKAPVLFEGIAHSLNPENSLVLKILSASSSSYSANPTSKLSSPPSLSGTAISLVSVVQARNNARIMVSGSLEMFSNRLFRSGVQKSGSSHKYGKSGNEQFITELSKWIFHERGHLKAVHVKHNKVGETEEPPIYRINDDLEFSVEVFEWSGSSWVPYVANDVQVQFYMMSPYVLKTLSTNQKGLYHTSFKVPDVYGVFQFKVEYQRLGYTSLSLAKQFPYAY